MTTYCISSDVQNEVETAKEAKVGPVGHGPAADLLMKPMPNIRVCGNQGKLVLSVVHGMEWCNVVRGGLVWN